MPHALTKEAATFSSNKKLSTSWPAPFVHAQLRLKKIRRFICFSLSGLTGIFVNMAALYLLREFGHFGLTCSAIIATELAIVNNFFLNDLWTFKDIASRKKGLKERVKRFLKFNLVCFSGLILNILILNALYNHAGINEYSANLIAIAIVTFWNFWFNLKISWHLPAREIGELGSCK